MSTLQLKANRLWCIKSLIAFWILNAIPAAAITVFSLSFIYFSLKGLFASGILAVSSLTPFALWLLYAIFAVFLFTHWVLAVRGKSFITLFKGILSVLLWLIPTITCAAYTIYLALLASDSTPDTDYGGDPINLWEYVPFALLGLVWFSVPLAISIFMIFGKNTAEQGAAANP